MQRVDELLAVEGGVLEATGVLAVDLVLDEPPAELEALHDAEQYSRPDPSLSK